MKKTPGSLDHEKERKEANELKAHVIEGYRDMIAGRTIKFSGDLKADLEKWRRISRRSS